MKVNLSKRIKKLMDIISKDSEAFLVTNIKNIRYLTGFSGSSAVLLCTEEKSFLLIDFRYLQQAKREVQIEIVEVAEKWYKTLKDILIEKKIKTLGFESTLSFENYSILGKNLEIKLIPQYNIIENMRAIKDEEEIKNIREAIRRAEEAFLKIKPFIKEGTTERDITLMLEYEIKKQGAVQLPFPVIVASGPNSSMPHWKNSNRKLQKGDFVIIDWGAECNGYFSDMTRTFIVGKPTEKQVEIYNIVNKARQAAIEIIRAGIISKEIDGKARNLIKQWDYGENFGHATGHGVGMDIHEIPKIGPDGEEIIKNGMVFTVEPGVYIEGFGGVRLEDMVLIKDDSFEVITHLSRDLEIL